MALCERCGIGGHDMRDMTTDSENKKFVGPCCVRADPMKMFEKEEVVYGIEFSSHMGLKAYASYGGLAVEFKKTHEELNKWMKPKDLEPEGPLTDETEQTTSQTLN